MAITVAPYSFTEFNNLLDFGDAGPKFDNLNGQNIATGEMRELFRRYLALLHKHMLLKDGERLTDVRGTSNPLTFNAGQPSVWKFNTDGQQLLPLEYSVDQGEINWQNPNIQEFLKEFFKLLEKTCTVDILGLVGYPGDGYPGRVEFTTGRSNVNFTPSEAQKYLSSIPGGTREAAWFYTDDFSERGCKCNCFTRPAHNLSHGYTVSI